jgi:hypothetical protein
VVAEDATLAITKSKWAELVRVGVIGLVKGHEKILFYCDYYESIIQRRRRPKRPSKAPEDSHLHIRGARLIRGRHACRKMAWSRPVVPPRHLGVRHCLLLARLK